MARVLLAMFALAGVVRAAAPISSVAELGALERQKDDFYDALATPGRAMTAAWSVPEAAVPRDRDIALSLVVGPVLNPEEVRAPDLMSRPEFAEKFSTLTTVPPTFDPATGLLSLRYLGRARAVGRLDVPELKFAYYVPQAGRFQAAYADASAISVEAPASQVSKRPLDGPPEFFEERQLDTWHFSRPPAWLWIAPIPVVALAAAAWIALWHRRYPNAAKLVKLRRIRSVRLALDRLDRPGSSFELAGILRDYLIARYGLVSSAQTTGDVVHGLAEIEWTSERIATVERFLSACDTARFAPESDSRVSAEELRDMILNWEGATS